MKVIAPFTKEDIKLLYYKKGLNVDRIGGMFGVSGRTVIRHMDRWGMKRRTKEEVAAMKRRARMVEDDALIGEIKEVDNPSVTAVLDKIIDALEPHYAIDTYSPISRENIWLSLPLKWFMRKEKKKANITLTICVSDIHLGDCNHLHGTYWSTVETLTKVLNVLADQFNIRNVFLILNGDMVSGREVYRYQVYNNLLGRGHWQVFGAVRVVLKTMSAIEAIVPINTVFLTKGTHESLAENYILYLKQCVPKSRYLGKFGVINIGKPIGNYNILVTHGTGRSEYYPVSYKQIRDLWKSINQYKMKGIPIERCLVGHSHWLTPNLELEGLLVDETGGFQFWEKSIQQRPCGMLLYIYYDGEVAAVPIKPNHEVEMKEKARPDLEYSNMFYYAGILKEHYESDKMMGVISDPMASAS